MKKEEIVGDEVYEGASSWDYFSLGCDLVDLAEMDGFGHLAGRNFAFFGCWEDKHCFVPCFVPSAEGRPDHPASVPIFWKQKHFGQRGSG